MPRFVSLYPRLLAGLVAAAAAPLAATGPACAQVLFSTLGPGDTFGSGGAVITGPTSSFGTYRAAANSFSLANAGLIGQVEVVLYRDLASATHTVTLAIAPASPSGNLPLSAAAVTLGNLDVTNVSPGLLSLTPATPFAAAPDTLYYLLLTPAADTSAVLWSFSNNPGGSGGLTSNTPGGGYNPGSVSAFRLSTVVPEPSTWALLGAGLVVLVGGASRRLAAGQVMER